MMMFILCGIFLLITGVLIVANRQIKKSHCTGVTKGKVTDIIRQKHRERDSEGETTISTSFYPVLEYTVGENTYVKKSSSGSSVSTYFIGQEIEIHYNPEKPEEYYANQNIGPMIVGMGLSIVGFILLGISLFIKM